MSQKLIFTNQVTEAVDQQLSKMAAPSVFVITDENTSKYVFPKLKSQCKTLENAIEITIPPGDDNKNADALQFVWKMLTDKGATRQSVVVNLGGGMITDLGGFAAATFKRGVRFINVPTSLLGAVDAAVGGKTGINFNGYKNEIGAFREADAVIISTIFFTTLPHQQLLSGYAEMLKHGLLDDKATLSALMAFDMNSDNENLVGDYDDDDKLLKLVEKSVGVKKAVVDSDPTEKGLRKALNLGHTIGHAFESFAMTDRQNPIPHGYAVAWGLVCELILSNMKQGFPSDTLHQLAKYVKENYGGYYIECKDYPRLLEIMAHDKKNASPDAINFTLLKAVGEPVLDQIATPDEIKEALDIYRDLM